MFRFGAPSKLRKREPGWEHDVCAERERPKDIEVVRAQPAPKVFAKECPCRDVHDERPERRGHVGLALLPEHVVHEIIDLLDHHPRESVVVLEEWRDDLHLLLVLGEVREEEHPLVEHLHHRLVALTNREDAVGLSEEELVVLRPHEEHRLLAPEID